jgi:hypothetical protein
MNQDASSLHKEMLENVLDMEAENDALKKVAWGALVGITSDVKNTVEEENVWNQDARKVHKVTLINA